MTNEDETRLDRHTHPLVRIERDTVGEANGLELSGVASGKDGRRAVGAVDVQPYVLFAADLGDIAERIDGACVHGSRAGDDRDRRRALRPIARDRRGERRRAHPKGGVVIDDAM